ncbi:MAG: 4Fe-4S binding protein [Bacteroidota bacterium]|nr:4Fe-4S binding protein [Bacteroidota bacterium]
METRKTYHHIRNARRISQAVFLVLFFYLLSKTDVSSFPTNGGLQRLNTPVALFLEFDPLIAFLTVVSAHELYQGMIWALVILTGTFFLGRFFCGWMCPLGTMSHLVSAIHSGRLKGKSRLEANRYRPYQRWKYIGLAVFVGAALVGAFQVGLMDPIALTTRSLADAFIPAWNLFMQSVSSAFTSFDVGSRSSLFYRTGRVFEFLATRSKPVFFQSALFLAVIFIGVLAANRFITRFWCRGLCPLGAFLGLCSSSAVFGLQKNRSACTDCNRCALHCQGGDDPQPGMVWRQAECHLCFNCVADCPEAGLEFRFFPGRRETKAVPDIGRRTVLTSLVSGIAIVPIMRAETGLKKGVEPTLVRPPGSLMEEEFLARCVKCSACMNVCPTNALHPTFLQAGFEGMWSPMLVPTIGYCEPTCVLCGTVCPTGAIDEITPAEKGWVPMRGGERHGSKPIRIGTAFYDFGRCLPWAMGIECIVCEEWCPTSPKAIYLEETQVLTRQGEVRVLKRPHVDPTICVGCGACTFACPVKGKPAITVSNTGETRNPRNSFLLRESA